LSTQKEASTEHKISLKVKEEKSQEKRTVEHKEIRDYFKIFAR
jgi:hypothetical protein